MLVAWETDKIAGLWFAGGGGWGRGESVARLTLWTLKRTS